MGKDKNMGKVFCTGHAVEYTYKHHLNSRSFTWITKTGVLVRAVRDRKNLDRPTGYYMVKFSNNKTLSKIHESKLTPIIFFNH